MQATTTLRTAYKILRATASEKSTMRAIYDDFVADFCFEEGESMELGKDGISIIRTRENGEKDCDWRFAKCSCGKIEIYCASSYQDFCFGCNAELVIENRRVNAERI